MIFICRNFSGTSIITWNHRPLRSKKAPKQQKSEESSTYPCHAVSLKNPGFILIGGTTQSCNSVSNRTDRLWRKITAYLSSCEHLQIAKTHMSANEILHITACCLPAIRLYCAVFTLLGCKVFPAHYNKNFPSLAKSY